MRDITMCSGLNCPFKEKCARATTPPKEYQSYFAKPPFKTFASLGRSVSTTAPYTEKTECEHFMKNGI